MARNDALLRLQKTLLTRRSELLKRLGNELTDLERNSTGVSGDSADVAFDASGEEISSQLADLEAKELIQIEHALKRLKQGIYGLCEGCNSKIPVIRLDALPYITLCIKCQREMESDSNWQNEHSQSNWGQIKDSDPSDRELRLSDIEMDISS